ncbi:MAG: PKD domain-containing protein, partial [Bacteroidota bacterium]
MRNIIYINLLMSRVKVIFTSLLIFFALNSFGQKKTCIDFLLMNPEYQDEVPLIEQLRKKGITDEEIFKYLDDKVKEKRAIVNAQNPVLPQKHKMPVPPVAFSAGCNDIDIGVENGNFGNWRAETKSWSINSPFCTGYNFYATPWASASLPVPGRITIVPSPSVDICADVPGFPINLPSPMGGNFSIQLGNNSVGAQTEKLIHTLNVTPSDTNFIYQYAVVFENPTAHLPSEMPYFDFVILDQNNDTVLCSFQHYVSGPNLPGFHTSLLSNPNCNNLSMGPEVIYYKPWTVVGVNLSAYIGQTVTIICTNADCARCGHMGITYLDFICGTLPTITQYCVTEDSVLLTASNEPGFTYTWSTGQTTSSAIVNPQIVDTVIVKVTPPSNCSFYLVYALSPTVITPHIYNSINCNTVSFGDSSKITGGTIDNWLWSFPGGTPSSSTLQNPVVTYPTAGNYTASCTITSQAGCKNTSANLLVPIVDISINAGSDLSVCQGSSTTLIGNGTPSGGTYSWLPSTNLNNPNVNNPTAGPIITATTYTLVYTYTNGCKDTDVVSVGINSLPIITAGNNASVCANNNGNNCPTIFAAGGTNYVWGPVNGLSNPNISNPVACPSVTTIYTVIGTDANGCSDTAGVTVTALSPPVVNVSAPVSICLGQTTAALTANATPSGGTYSWVPAMGLNN